MVDYRFAYTVFSMFAMFLYYMLLFDLTVISTRISAFGLVCVRMLSEVDSNVCLECMYACTYLCTVGIVRTYIESFYNLRRWIRLFESFTFLFESSKTASEQESYGHLKSRPKFQRSCSFNPYLQ